MAQGASDCDHKSRTDAATYLILNFVPSAGLTLFNRWFMGTYGFAFPLFATAASVLVVRLLALAYLQSTPAVSNRQYYHFILPIGVLTGFDYGLSNLSFRYTGIPLYVVVKDLTPVFVLAFGQLLGVHRPTRRELAAVALVIAGVWACVFGQFSSSKYAGAAVATWPTQGLSGELFGMLCVACAALMQALRLVLSQLVMRTPAHPGCEANPGSSAAPSRPLNPVELCFLLSPVSAAALLPFITVLEVPGLWRACFVTFEYDTVVVCAFLCGLGCVSFLVKWSEFNVVLRLSATTLQMAGLAKDCVMLLGSVVLLFDQISAPYLIGFALVTSGMALYSHAG